MWKQIKKIIAILFLTSAVLFTQIPAQKVSADTAGAGGFVMDGYTLVQYTGTDSSVSVPDSVKKISENAFSGDKTLQSVSIPAKVQEIGSAAFSNCTALTSVQIAGTNLTQLGDGVFAGCSSLKNVSFDSSAHFVCTDGCIYNNDRTRLIEVLQGNDLKSLSIPSSVKSLGSFSFWGCSKLEKVVMPDGIETVSAYAFSGCTSLKDVTLPATLRLIDMKAFQNCTALSAITIPPTAKVDATAFEGCTGLPSSDTAGSADTVNHTTGTTSAVSGNNTPEKSVSGNNTTGDSTTGNSTTGDSTTGNSTTDNSTSGTETAESGTDQYVIHAAGESLGNSKIVGQRAVLFIDRTKQKVIGGETVETAQPSQEQETMQGIDTTLSGESVSVSDNYAAQAPAESEIYAVLTGDKAALPAAQVTGSGNTAGIPMKWFFAGVCLGASVVFFLLPVRKKQKKQVK